MDDAYRDPGYESHVLLRQLDRHLAGLRGEPGGGTDLYLAERIAGMLRQLIADTAFASAADRARARAAVHFFLLRRSGRRRRQARALSEDLRVVNEIVAGLGRSDLVLRSEPAVPAY